MGIGAIWADRVGRPPRDCNRRGLLAPRRQPPGRRARIKKVAMAGWPVMDQFGRGPRLQSRSDCARPWVIGWRTILPDQVVARVIITAHYIAEVLDGC
jgi:hypothetical protein